MAASAGGNLCMEPNGENLRRLGEGTWCMSPTLYPSLGLAVSIYQHIGGRRTQEDRFTVCPNVPFYGESVSSRRAFFGIFDGTVGDFASDTVKDLVVPKLAESPNWQALASLLKRQVESPEEATGGESQKRIQQLKEQLLVNAVTDMHREADKALIARCSQQDMHYATSTSATLLVMDDLLAVGHLGDSRVVIGKEVDGGGMVGEQLTVDHKPDMYEERQRIERSGGTVECLQNHNNKPFIRGGDFTMRKALGEQPMQLQYSRAFGGKDLKMFGLVSEPDVSVIPLGKPPYRRVRWAVLASDGLWDVCSAQQAVTVAQHAHSNDQSPAEALVRLVLLEQQRRNTKADNVTVICVHFESPDPTVPQRTRS